MAINFPTNISPFLLELLRHSYFESVQDDSFHFDRAQVVLLMVMVAAKPLHHQHNRRRCSATLFLSTASKAISVAASICINEGFRVGLCVDV